MSRKLEIRYDAEADAAYIYVVPSGSARAITQSRFCDVEFEGGSVFLELDAANALMGIEILGASKVLPPNVLLDSEA